MRSLSLKRLMDVTGATMGLIVFAPLLLVTVVICWFTMGSPVFFCQSRPGLRGKPFTLRKFRTMREARAPNGELLDDTQRLTSFGRFLRSTSLDELPTLLNVLTGDMSLVGPRPLLMEYLDRYTSHQARRHEVKPGITGWAQVNGRNAVSWEEKFAFDVWYVDHWNIWLDVKICCLTVMSVLKRQGISAPGHDTMPVFTGKNGKTFIPVVRDEHI